LDPERVWQHIFILGTIMTAVVLFTVLAFSFVILKNLFHKHKTSGIKLHKSKIVVSILMVLLTLSAIIFGIPVVNEQQYKYSAIEQTLHTYYTLNQDDLSLMHWIKENIPANQFILISAGDSGQFLTAVTQRPSSYYANLKNYGELLDLLTSNSSDLNAVPLLIEDNVSYVYMGSIATTFDLQNPAYRHLNATQFLETPYFTMTKEFGDAWLFQFNASAALIAYDTYDTTS
jgi:NADH:ubiquinone oxidoreductase subunit 5 (subunit L)/multisubunit Na+/H+ antiporter MnhA subunit